MKVFQTMEFSRPKAKPLGAHIIKALSFAIASFRCDSVYPCGLSLIHI